MMGTAANEQQVGKVVREEKGGTSKKRSCGVSEQDSRPQEVGPRVLHLAHVLAAFSVSFAAADRVMQSLSREGELTSTF